MAIGRFSRVTIMAWHHLLVLVCVLCAGCAPGAAVDPMRPIDAERHFLNDRYTQNGIAVDRTQLDALLERTPAAAAEKQTGQGLMRLAAVQLLLGLGIGAYDGIHAAVDRGGSTDAGAVAIGAGALVIAGLITAAAGASHYARAVQSYNRELGLWAKPVEPAVAAPTGRHFRALASGRWHACALDDQGQATCAGVGARKQPCDDNNLLECGQSRPPDGPFAELAAGQTHTCGLRPDGTVACWGSNLSGQSAPPAGIRFRHLCAGDWHTCGITQQGTLACFGALAGPHDAGQSRPPAGEFAALSCGSFFSCALRADGTVACWGDNTAGQRQAPAEMFKEIAAGSQHVCALTTAGAVRCWGLGGFGQCQAPAGTFAHIAAGIFHSCALRQDGTLACWGDADIPAGPEIAFTEIGVGVRHTCGLARDKTVHCWCAREQTLPGAVCEGF